MAGLFLFNIFNRMMGRHSRDFTWAIVIMIPVAVIMFTWMTSGENPFTGIAVQIPITEEERQAINSYECMNTTSTDTGSLSYLESKYGYRDDCSISEFEKSYIARCVLRCENLI